MFLASTNSSTLCMKEKTQDLPEYFSFTKSEVRLRSQVTIVVSGSELEPAPEFEAGLNPVISLYWLLNTAQFDLC